MRFQAGAADFQLVEYNEQMETAKFKCRSASGVLAVFMSKWFLWNVPGAAPHALAALNGGSQVAQAGSSGSIVSAKQPEDQAAKDSKPSDAHSGDAKPPTASPTAAQPTAPPTTTKQPVVQEELHEAYFADLAFRMLGGQAAYDTIAKADVSSCSPSDRDCASTIHEQIFKRLAVKYVSAPEDQKRCVDAQVEKCSRCMPFLRCFLPHGIHKSALCIDAGKTCPKDDMAYCGHTPKATPCTLLAAANAVAKGQSIPTQPTAQSTSPSSKSNPSTATAGVRVFPAKGGSGGAFKGPGPGNQPRGDLSGRQGCGRMINERLCCGVRIPEKRGPNLEILEEKELAGSACVPSISGGKFSNGKSCVSIIKAEKWGEPYADCDQFAVTLQPANGKEGPQAAKPQSGSTPPRQLPPPALQQQPPQQQPPQQDKGNR